MDAAKVKAALAEIAARNGGILTADAVVQEAEPDGSVLHDCFEWDNEKAAHQHRLEQARGLIRSVKLEIVRNERVISAVYWVRDPEQEPDKQGYRSVVALHSEEHAAHLAILAEFQRADALLARARNLAEVLDFTGEIDDLITAVRAARVRLEEGRLDH